MKRLIVILSLLAALCSATVSSAAGNTDHVDAATSVLLVGSDGRAAIPTGAAGVTSTVAQLPAAAALGDSLSNPTTTQIGANIQTWNAAGAVWERPWSNVQLTGYIASGTYTSTQTGADQLNPSGRGVRCIYDVTAVTAVGSFTVEIDGKDATSGKYYALLTATAVTTTGTNILTVYPGITAVSSAPNFAASQVMPRSWRAKATYNSGTNQTFSVGCDVML